MQIDFHFGVTYVVARLAGLQKEQAYKIAYSAQFVDDAIHEGVLRFKDRSSFSFIASAHKMLDYKNFVELANKLVWIPFHFLPGNQLVAQATDVSAFEQRLICRPNSEVAKSIIELCLKQHAQSFAPHLMGVMLHAYADTWAHQGFSGITSRVNQVSDIYDQAGHLDEEMTQYRARFFRGSRFVSIWEAFKQNLSWTGLWNILSFQFVSRVNPIGHGAVLSYPDLPFKKWQYKNWQGQIVERNNPQDFFEAAQNLFKVLRQFALHLDSAAASSENPQQSADWQLIHETLMHNQFDTGEKRLRVWLDLLAQGRFSFGAELLQYQSSGHQSWLYKALGFQSDTEFVTQNLDVEPQFLQSDWKLLHDALIFY